jgi:hypothetical protein
MSVNVKTKQGVRVRKMAARNNGQDVSRPRPECLLQIQKETMLLRSEMAAGFAGINSKLDLMSQQLKDVDTRLRSVEVLLEGNGEPSYKELRRSVTSHIKSHQDLGIKKWQIVSSLGVGACLALLNVWLILTVIQPREQAQRAIVERVEAQQAQSR